MGAFTNITSKTFSSLKIRNYRLYFFGQTVSYIGTWMQVIGLSWLVLKLTNSGTQLGLVVAAQFLPVLLIGPVIGIVADRYDKRKIVFITQTLFAILALTLGLLVSFGLIKLWMIYCIAAGTGFLAALDSPTRQTFVYEMVGPEHLSNAISLNSTLYNLSRIVGPAIAGILIVTVGLAPGFYINAASFVALLIALKLMNVSELHKNSALENMKGQLTDGLKYIASEPLLRDTLFFMAILGIFIYEFTVSVPLLAQYTFHGGAQIYAALTSAMGIGAVLGGLFAASRKNPTISYLLWAISALGIAMFATALSSNLIFGLISMALIGFTSTNYTSRSNVLLQLNSKPQMRGRVLALWNVVLVGSTPIGGPIIGYISQQFNPRWGFALGGFSAVVVLIYGLLRMKKTSAKVN